LSVGAAGATGRIDATPAARRAVDVARHAVSEV
jgi:hypothetical protein